MKKRRLREIMPWGTNIRYLLWRARGERGPFRVELLSGEKFWVRPRPCDDLSLAFELFLSEAYRRPPEVPEIEPKVIVDAGANVGIALALFGRLYPKARLIAFEPMPAHVEMVRRQVELNGWSGRTRIVGAAVSNSSGKARMKPLEAQSHFTESGDPLGVDVEVVDFFENLSAERVDLLKLDIEGGEFRILGDDRFGAMNIPLIAMEWHNTPEIPDAAAWCRDRLQSLGYRVADGAFANEVAGMLWAWKPR